MDNLTKDPTIRNGLVCGLFLGAFLIGFNIVNNLMNIQGAAYIWLNRGISISLFLFLTLAGFFTHQAKPGAKAGFTAGLVGVVIGNLSMWIITFLFMDVIAQNTYMIMDFQKSGAASMNQFIIEDAMGATVIAFIASLVLGTVLGFIGGWLGKFLTAQPTSGQASAL